MKEWGDRSRPLLAWRGITQSRDALLREAGLLLRGLLVLAGMVAIGTVIWNLTRPGFPVLPPDYVVVCHEPPCRGRLIDRAGVDTVIGWLEKNGHRSLNPLGILFHHLWYNCITDGYDLQIRIEPLDRPLGEPQFILYVWGTTVFVRQEFQGWNWVQRLDCRPAELLARLASLSRPLPAEAPGMPAKGAEARRRPH